MLRHIPPEMVHKVELTHRSWNSKVITFNQMWLNEKTTVAK